MNGAPSARFPRTALGEFTVRLRRRSGSERMGKNSSPYVFEVGFMGRIGGAIAVYVDGDVDLTSIDELERLFAMALELWSKERRQVVERADRIIMLPPRVA